MKIIKFFRKIYIIIKAIIETYIIIPIKGWIQYLVDGSYIQDNDRNRQAMDFLFKVAKDGNYQPSTPTEHFLEKHLYEAYQEAIAKNEQIIRDEYDGEIPTYEEVRSECAQQIALDLLSFRWIDDSKWDDE